VSESGRPTCGTPNTAVPRMIHWEVLGVVGVKTFNAATVTLHEPTLGSSRMNCGGSFPAEKIKTECDSLSQSLIHDRHR